MPHYFLLHDPNYFQDRLVPAFAKSWQSKSFEPIVGLADQLSAGKAVFNEKFRMGADETMLECIARGMKFDKAIWEMALSEALFYGCKEAPDTPISFNSLRFLLGSVSENNELTTRADWPWIDRAILGSHTLRLGRGVYRPGQSGWNGPADAAQVSSHLHGVDPAIWDVGQLRRLDVTLDEEDLTDELALARDALEGIRAIYETASRLNLLVFCEHIA